MGHEPTPLACNAIPLNSRLVTPGLGPPYPIRIWNTAYTRKTAKTEMNSYNPGKRNTGGKKYGLLREEATQKLLIQLFPSLFPASLAS